ncbi:hypothetical protein GURASL_20890 [Geotalea uraniireducens]|uniref:Glycine zipper 2TM domain-containing protein n=1 Tax=Geotalea uraniireducens TaxID=351604 RepID=A0ABM8EMA3_9BACT|nr:hypothetical protein [Geotalea uraniireducens]BDV43166.1 hypothetical protein GURASL_20890 [Geotalea uraniireducens]
MGIVKRIGWYGVVAAWLIGLSSPCFADDSGFESIFRNALYGGMAGGLVGAAVLAFTHKPANHLDYIGYGAAGGVLAGAAYGVVKSAHALAEVENGKVRLAVPTVVPDYVPAGAHGPGAVVVSAELLRGKF